MSLTLLRGPPRVMGLTAKDNPYASLHGNSKPVPERAPSPTLEEINALPESASDTSSVKADEEDDVSSDDSMPEARGSRRKSRLDSEPWKGRDSSSINGHDNRSLWNPPSSIPDSSFETKKASASCSGSQRSQKRGRVEFEEEEDDSMSIWGSQSRKPRTKYGTSSQRTGILNIHSSGAMEGPKSTKMHASPNSRKDKPQFRRPSTSWEDSIVGKRESNIEKREFKKPPSNETTPRSQRASQRSSRSTDGSQCTPAKAFKQPPKLSPRKVKSSKAPTFHTVSVEGEEAGARRATRSSAPAVKSLEPAQPRASTTSEIYKSANIAASKLGFSDLQLKPPSLSIETASEPSTYLDADAASSTVSPLSSVPEEVAFPASEEKDRMIMSEAIIIPKYTQRPSCPFCKELVDKDFLEEHININERLSIRQQAQFCKAHKKRAAEDEWKNMQYPTIDWANLNSRLNDFHSILDDILQQRRNSFYRNAFEDLVRARKSKTTKTVREDLLDANRIEELIPGYYGSRGARMMTENIMSKFASKIRRLAASDELILLGGVSEFVQAVLVPEMAVLLVQADMNIDDEEKARDVVRHSVDIGHMLNEEEDEVIKDPDPEELKPMELT